MSDVLNLGSMNFGSMVDTFVLWGFVLVLMVGIGLLIYFLWDKLRYNVKVELMRQVGEPFYQPIYDETGKEIGKDLRINYRQTEASGRLYHKKMRGGGSKEYFKIKGYKWDYQNFYSDTSFFERDPGLFDFKRKGIKLFVSQSRGLVPMMCSNPSFKVDTISLNEVIGAISDSLHEREELFDTDFWSKYGQIITVSFLIGFLVVGMIFIIKYQEVFWENSMKALTQTIQAVKEVSAPAIQ